MTNTPSPTYARDPFRWAVLGVFAGLTLTAAGLWTQNDIVVGTGLSIMVGAVGFGTVTQRKPK